jgi:streptogramin lyase
MPRTRWLTVLILAVHVCAPAAFAGPSGGKDDPAVGLDGALCYTAQLANALGRLDPKSGAIKEFPLKTPDSGPHRLAIDKAGFVWFTANFKAYIGRIDPQTALVHPFGRRRRPQYGGGAGRPALPGLQRR